MKEVSTEDIFKRIVDIIGGAGVEHTNEDIYLIMGCVEQFKKSGYTFTFDEIATFLVSDKNLKMIEEEGLNKTILAMSRMKLGTITKAPVQGRNEKCACGSGKKFKQCCINK